MHIRSLTVSIVFVFIATSSITYADIPKFSRGPYLQDLTSRQFALLFELDEARSVTVRVARGVSSSSNNSKDAASPIVQQARSGTRDTVHEIVVGGLEPATTYSYEIMLHDSEKGPLISSGQKGTLTTAPEDERPFSFLVYGDNRTDNSMHAMIVRTMQQTVGDFLVHTGDMVHNGTNPNDWSNFFSIEHELLRNRCVFPTIGNHEIWAPSSDGAQRYARLFRVPGPLSAAERYYTFRWGNARFFMIDSQDDFSSNERTWLEQTLKAAKEEKGLVWRFAVMHFGPFSSGPHQGNRAMKIARVPELLREHKIDAIFAGHDHAYERGATEGLRYVISGGGGAPLYARAHNAPSTQRYESIHHFLKIELANTKATMTVLRSEGSTLEQCIFNAGGGESWQCTPASASAASTPTLPQSNSAPRIEQAIATSSTPKQTCGCNWAKQQAEWFGPVAAGGLLTLIVLRSKNRKHEH